MQVFYARDNKTKGRLKVVLEGKRKIVGVDGVTDEEDYRGYQEMPPFGANVVTPRCYDQHLGTANHAYYASSSILIIHA